MLGFWSLVMNGSWVCVARPLLVHELVDAGDGLGGQPSDGLVHAGFASIVALMASGFKARLVEFAMI